ncbi:MAG TPA: ABC transporter permease [Isosphaeraceae bacterium]|jgi:ABC-2 type transport system permease protein|nr:ABC transporter permease [Isosphaeraceae bacterium]
MNVRQIRALVCKDLRLTFSDRRAVIISFIVPIALGTFMAIVMGGTSDGPAGRIAIDVTDLDQSPQTRKIVANLASEKSLEVKPLGEAEAREEVRKGNVVVAVVFPKGFGSAAGKALFGPGPKPELLLLHDPSHNAEMSMVRGILMQHIMEQVSTDAFTGKAGLDSIKDAIKQVNGSDEVAPADKQSLLRMFDGIQEWMARSEQQGSEAPNGAESLPLRGGFKTPFETKEQVVTAGGQVSKTAMQSHAFAGMAVQFILFGSIEAAVGLLTERQRGLWKRLRAAPLSRFDLLTARALSGTILGLLTTATVFGFAMAVFPIRIEGSTLGFVLIAISYALCAATFGLLVAALGKSPQAARGVSILVVLLMVMLGGAWMPTFIFPHWLQQVTPVIPTRWAVDGFDGVFWRGYSLAEALRPTLALLGFATVFGFLAIDRFRWDAD